jgi:hypothetical protein
MFCWGKTEYSEYQDFSGHWQREAIETVSDDCPCSERHWYQDFAEKLNRLHPGLHFGWDRLRHYFVVFRYTYEPIRLAPKLWEGAHLSYLNRFIDIVLECKQFIRQAIGKTGWRPVLVPREPGVWVFAELRGSTADRFDPHNRWGQKQLAAYAKREDEGIKQELKDTVEAIHNDNIPLCDPGDPFRLKIRVRVPEKPKEMATAAS